MPYDRKGRALTLDKEAEIHFALYRHLQNSIEERNEYHGVQFGSVVPEKTVDSGVADIVINDVRGRPLVVIEAKREYAGRYDRNLDPYSPKVIEQAFGYAGKLGSEYFATYNGKHLVLFRTFEKGVGLLERKTRAYRVRDVKRFSSELLEQIASIKTGKLGWEADPVAFVNRLKIFHGRLASELHFSLKENLKGEFGVKYVGWVNRQGWDPEEESELRFVRQAAYLLMNKLLFYKVLEDTGHNVPKLTLKKLVDPSERIKAFNSIIDAVDFEAVYEHDPIYDEIPLTKRASQEVREFLEELEDYELDRFEHDTIGHIYENIIPPMERHDLGQYYTPPEVVELITRLTIKNPNDKVLDPGCGSGTFLVTAYNRLKKLKEQAGISATHKDILSQLFGIDINRFPAHLTAINLALQDLKVETKDINLEVQDFFNIRPSQSRLYSEKVRVDRGKKESEYIAEIPSKVDVVVANPPYVRQEKIKDKKLCREHLKRLKYERISERSDIYVYFFTHSTEFLEENGRIGFITSDKWLTVGYGKEMQQFFLDHFKIKAIISFGQRVFETPLVPTCITILERCQMKDERESNLTKFLRIKKQLSLDEIVSMIESRIEKDVLMDKENFRLIVKEQRDLKDIGKWNRYLHAPTIYWEILGHKKLCKLEEVAEVRRGITSGANDFFYLKEDKAKSWGITNKFLRPLAKSIRQADSVEFTKSKTDTFVIDIHDFVKEQLSGIHPERMKGIRLDDLPSNAKLADVSNEELWILHQLRKEDKGLYQYIVHAMWGTEWPRYGPPHKRPTCLPNRGATGCWFDLGPLKPSPLLSSKEYWEYGRPLVLINVGNAIADQQLYTIDPKSVDLRLLAGILNSSLACLFREMHGRTTGGGMNRLTVEEAKELLLLNPFEIEETEKNRIVNELDSLERKRDLRKTQLDKAVLAPLGLEDYAREVSAYAEALSKARREGKEVGAMIEGVETKRPRTKKLQGAEILDTGGQRKIDQFV